MALEDRDSPVDIICAHLVDIADPYGEDELAQKDPVARHGSDARQLLDGLKQHGYRLVLDIDDNGDPLT